jgi:hypothetical protein
MRAWDRGPIGSVARRGVLWVPQSSEACILIWRSNASSDYVVSSELNNVSSGALPLRDDSKQFEKRVCASVFRDHGVLLGKWRAILV